MVLTPNLGAFRYPIALVVALLLSLYFTPIIRRGALRYGVVDRPDGALKQHEGAIPYLGGVSIFLSFLFALAFTYDFTAQVLAILLSASIIVTIGLFDDLKVLTPAVKLLGQLVAALVLIKAGIMIQLTFLPDWLALLLTLLWLVGMTNAINLIDVSDGLAAGVASIACLFLYVVALWDGRTTIAMLTLALVGATLGFLAYNRPPARIYLGDTGSMLLGFMLAALTMSGHYTFKHPVGGFAPVVILGVPIFDTLFVMGARLVRGIPVMQGSPDHFAVRFRDHGLKPGVIAAISYASATVLGILGLLLCILPEGAAWGILASVMLLAAGSSLGLARLGRGPRAEVARTTQAPLPPPNAPPPAS